MNVLTQLNNFLVHFWCCHIQIKIFLYNLFEKKKYIIIKDDSKKIHVKKSAKTSFVCLVVRSI